MGRGSGLEGRVLDLGLEACVLDLITKLTASASNRLKPVYQQSWLQGLLIRRTRGGLGRLALARWAGWSAGLVGRHARCYRKG